jgi:predicted permease
MKKYYLILVLVYAAFSGFTYYMEKQKALAEAKKNAKKD